MGLKDRRLRTVEPEEPKKQQVLTPKKVVKKVVVAVKEEAKKAVVKKEKPVKNVPAPVIETPVTNKKDWDGIGLIGAHPEISLFKGVCKMKGLKVGEQLLNIIKEWNIKNK